MHDFIVDFRPWSTPSSPTRSPSLLDITRSSLHATCRRENISVEIVQGYDIGDILLPS